MQWRAEYTRLAVALGATAYFLYYAATPGQEHFIDALNLVIHEAGHIVFYPFGQFLGILGGSLFQVLFPLIYVVYFYLRREYYSAALLLFWVGQNLINVSVYAGDAIAQQLPLLGGDSVIHDWNWLLSTLHILQYTSIVSSTLYWAGVLVILVAAGLSLAKFSAE